MLNRPLQIQRQQTLQDRLIAQIVRPGIGGEDGFVQLGVGQEKADGEED